MPKKKKGFTLLLLVIAMILMLVVYLLIVKINNQKELEKGLTASKTISLMSLDTDAVTEIHYQNAKGEMTLSRDDTNWANKSDIDFPVNQTYATGMLTAVSSIDAERKVSEKADDLKEFGLDDPSLVVTVTKEDGTTASLSFGIKVPTADYYYVMISGDDAIYTVSSTIYDSFDYSTSQMIEIDSTPTITAENITYLAIDNKDSDDFLVTNNHITDNDLSTYNPWDIEKPYAKAVVADTNSLTTLFGNYTAFNFSQCVDYHAKDLSKYGLDDPSSTVFIKYYETSTDTAATTSDTTASTTTDTASDDKTETKVNKEFKLYIGNTNENGDYYVKVEGSDSVNLMSADDVATMTNVTAYDYVSKNVSLIDIAIQLIL